MYFSTLSEWLSYIAKLHAFEMALGLERVKIVGEKLALLTSHCPIIIVGGTNGKGSTVAGLEAIYRAANYKTGVFTSPYLFRYNEQIRINGNEVNNAVLCTAFSEVEAARKDVALTPFEFGTLAALCLFKKHALDIVILEVGLGGRLDAVNIMDADVSIVTSIGIDHVEWLGTTREAIAMEKAGIFRNNKPAICGDFCPPQSLVDYAKGHHVPLFCQGKDFHYREKPSHWEFHYQLIHYNNLPFNTLATQNMATVVMAITLLQDRLPVERHAIDQGLLQTTLLGRIQTVLDPVVKIYDVSHNPQAVAWLADRMRNMPCSGKTYAVFSMLADKDITQSIAMIKDVIDVWYVAPLSTPRATSKENLERAFQAENNTVVTFFNSIPGAYDFAEKTAKTGDRIVVFGSFHTVAEVLNI